MTTRFYSSVASEKTLSGTITSGAAQMTVSNTIGLPSSFPYTLAVDYETVSEELVEVTSAAGSLLDITRGIDGTSATGHTAGARVRHVTSARDFSDSRNHENASTNIHGLTGGEAIVGTTSTQTLSNKTVIDLTGTLKNIEITNVPTHALTLTNTPAGAAGNNAFEIVNGSDLHVKWKNDGNLGIQNNAAMDTADTTRRFTVYASNGTTERFHVDASGMAVAAPRSGSANTIGGFKVIDPGDILDRKAIQVRNSADSADRFVVRGAGDVEITSTDPSQVSLYVQGAAAQATDYLTINDSTPAPLFTVNLNGKTIMNKSAEITAANAGSVPLSVKGFTAQTADLQQWNNSTGTTLARVFSDGTANFANQTASSGIVTPAAGWSTTSEVAVIKAGIATLNLILLRTGATISATSTGDVASDPAVGTISASYRPATFGGQSLLFTCGNENGDGTVILDPATGNFNLTSWSSSGSLATGTQFRATMTWPLA